MNKTKGLLLLLALCLSFSTLKAQLSLPHVFSDHMVLQRNMDNPVWGKASPGEKITLTIAGQNHQTIADKSGNWRVILNPMKAGGPFKLNVQGHNEISLEDILIGEVWHCAGQSNMQFSLNKVSNSEVEIASANYPEIRFLDIPRFGSQELHDDINAKWVVCTPESAKRFSATGFLFGRRLHNTLGVPIGLINTAWGASSLETWIPRESLDESKEYNELLEDWDTALGNYTDEVLENAQKKYDKWLAAGKPGNMQWSPRDITTGQNAPANGFNAMINPIVGYGIRGAIWCQGETNLGRAYQYRTMFPLLINSWREIWGQGAFPFYWVQMADFTPEDSKPSESMWAELREAQTMTLSVPNTGEVITMDLGEGRDIHYKNKQEVANRLVRHALKNDYGYEMKSNSPRYQSMELKGSVITITFDCIDQGLYAFDVEEVKGFAIAAKNKKFVWAKARIVGKNKVEVYSDEISKPLAVRYGWGHNPVVNLYDLNGLPVTGFRTDDWPGVTINNQKAIRQY